MSKSLQADRVTAWYHVDCFCVMEALFGWTLGGYWALKRVVLQKDVFCQCNHEEVDMALTGGYLQAGAREPAAGGHAVAPKETEQNPNEVRPF